MLPEGLTDQDIIGRECRFGTYCDGGDGHNDLVVAKEYLYTKDGRRIPNVALFPNYERTFYVTKKGFQNHYEKLEWEDKDKLLEFKCTEAEVAERAARAARVFGRKITKKSVAISPYVYGYDISTTALIKQMYKEKYPDFIHPTSSVAALDIETNVKTAEKEILVVGLTFQETVFIAVNSNWLAPTMVNIDAITFKYKELLAKWIESRKLKLEIVFKDTPGQCCEAAIRKAHILKPDYISIWNMDFDLPKMIETMKKEDMDLAEIFSDPAVPDQFKYFRYKKGQPTKVTQSGKQSAKHPADMWHTMYAPASFYFLDSMCIYKRIRAAAGMVSSYGLDAALGRHLDLGKLKFNETDHLSRTAWHEAMQTNYKIEYIIYNIFDCIGLELLDEKINDLGRSFDALSGVSDYHNFDSTPTRIVDDLHFYVEKRGKVIATAPARDDILHKYDDYVVDMKKWIATLASYLMHDNGIPIIKELPHVNSMARAHCCDIDIEGTYPNGEDIMNISKETTYRELHLIRGLTEDERRQVGIDLSGGVSNAVEICTKVLQLPSLSQLGDIYMKHKEDAAINQQVKSIVDNATFMANQQSFNTSNANVNESYKIPV